MNYIYKIDNLDCASCGAAMEKAISKIKGVVDCSVSFFSLKLTVKTDGEMSEDLFKKINKAVRKLGAKITAI